MVPEVVEPVTAYENLDFADDKFDIDQSDFMTKDNFTDEKRKRLSSIKRWSSNSKGVLEITPDPEVVWVDHVHFTPTMQYISDVIHKLICKVIHMYYRYYIY